MDARGVNSTPGWRFLVAQAIPPPEGHQDCLARLCWFTPGEDCIHEVPSAGLSCRSSSPTLEVVLEQAFATPGLRSRAVGAPARRQTA